MVVHNRDNPSSPRTINITWLLPVKNNLASPPASPVTGDRYRVLPSATGAWLGWDNSIAIFNGDTNKWEFDLLTESQVWYDFTAQNWHYMSNAGVITQFDKIPLAESDVTGLVADLAARALTVHHETHVSGGSDAFVGGDLLDATARSNVLNAGSLVSTRRGINFVTGSNVSITIVDDPTNEKADVTISAAGSSAHALLDGTFNNDTIAGAPSRGSVISGQGTSAKWEVLALGANGMMLVSNGIDLVWAALTSSQVTTALGFTPVNPAIIGAVNGIAELDGTGNVPSSELGNLLQTNITLGGITDTLEHFLLEE